MDEAAATDDEVQKFRDLMREYQVAMLTTTAADGALHSRPIATAQFGADLDLYFFARASSAQAADVALGFEIGAFAAAGISAALGAGILYESAVGASRRAAVIRCAPWGALGVSCMKAF